MALALFHVLADITLPLLTIMVQNSPNPTDKAYVIRSHSVGLPNRSNGYWYGGQALCGG